MYVFLQECAMPGTGRMFWRGFVALWIFSAAVSALATPDENSSQPYRWLFTFSHLLAANLDKIEGIGSFMQGTNPTAARRINPGNGAQKD